MLMFLWAIPDLFFCILVFYIQLTVKNVQYKFCRWLDSNHRPLVSEATTLPTESQPLPVMFMFTLEAWQWWRTLTETVLLLGRQFTRTDFPIRTNRRRRTTAAVRRRSNNSNSSRSTTNMSGGRTNNLKTQRQCLWSLSITLLTKHRIFVTWAQLFRQS